ncbi:7265_t:CDS:10 [Scutellospora calospora]|uniref:7265_t:CDS:1 n=1 Tax=Scutellospora calospora TaxID=85575 RepID=A0ACA9KXG0_9GLOM|nr:7265_t:CDS:10 [Scutellospora calospora]
MLQKTTSDVNVEKEEKEDSVALKTFKALVKLPTELLQKQLVMSLKQEDNGKSMGKKRFVETWKLGALVNILDVTDIHGEFYTDGNFGGLYWSKDEQKAVYIAEQKELDDSDDRKFDYTQSYGERFSNKCVPLIVVFNVSTNEAKVLPKFDKIDTGQIYITIISDGSNLGINRCDYVHLCAILLANKKLIYRTSKQSPRLNLSGNSLIYLSNSTGGPHSWCSELYEYNFSSKENRLIVPIVRFPSLSFHNNFPGIYQPDVEKVTPTLAKSICSVLQPFENNPYLELIVYKPKDVPSDKKPPLIVISHGGPHGVCVTRSVGFGQDCIDSLIGKIGNLEVEEVQATAQYFIDQNEVDPDAIALIGGSHAGHSSSTTVLTRLWQVNSNLFTEGCLEMHKKDAMAVSRILDIAQDLKYLNLEKWLQDNIVEYGDSFIYNCLEFLNRKVVLEITHETNGNIQSVRLSNDVIATYLRILHNSTISGENSELFIEVHRDALQVYPRLTNIRASSDSIVTYTEPSSFSHDFEEEEANSYYERVYRQAISIEDMIKLLQKFKNSQEHRENDIFSCVLMGYMALGIALRYVLNALRNPSDSEMFILENIRCFAELGLPHSQSKPSILKQSDYTKMFENSSISNIDKVKIPTLLMLGENDKRVPHVDGLGWWYYLKGQGKVEIQCKMYKETGHSLDSVEAEIQGVDTITKFLKEKIGL